MKRVAFEGTAASAAIEDKLRELARSDGTRGVQLTRELSRMIAAEAGNLGAA